jgi:hypothetical protein
MSGMLAIAPTHALSYSLSPKATLPFERARQRAAQRPVPQIDLALPRGRQVHEALPIDLDVLADPLRFFSKARISYRADEEEWRTVDVTLDDPGGRHHLTLPALAPRERAAVVELWVVIEDRVGNEVMLIGPREISLAHIPPEPWYESWWVWTIAGVAVAGGATAAILAATGREDPTISGSAIR